MLIGGICINLTGITRKLDNTGRIVLPSEYRKELGFKNLENLEIFIANDGVLIKKQQVTCKLCGENENFIIFKENLICLKCASELKKLFESGEVT